MAIVFIVDTGCSVPGPYCGDLVINSVTPVAVSPGVVDNQVEISNTGFGDVYIGAYVPGANTNASVIQNYRSADETFDISDVPAGGMILPGPDKPVSIGLLQKVVYHVYGNVEQFTIDQYPYLICVVTTRDNTNDCNKNNNTLAVCLKPSCAPVQ